jgi:hypothetical protein
MEDNEALDMLDAFDVDALEDGAEPELEPSAVAAALAPLPTPVSGRYEWRLPPGAPPARHGPGPLRAVRREDLRLDVDRHYPQATASGTLAGGLAVQIHWVARLRRTAATTWAGPIWYKDGAGASFPYTRVEITVVPSAMPAQRKAVAKFTRPGIAARTRTFWFRSQYFHPVNLEFDWAEAVTPTLAIDTCAHPNRPATLPCENLAIETVFKRAGFNVTTGAGGVVPFSGADTLWSDQEMHDAMQVYWSRFAAAPQWAMWILFASLHESGTNLGGIMFDDIGPNHRQGTALFVDSFVATPPAGDPNPADWVQRMIFWTACHEMGHSFNLAHSWQKSLGVGWVPLTDELEARSFMNYPFLVNGGEGAFFSDFEFRFSDQELLFMRHAPARFVEMGNAAWFDHHGFHEANVSERPAFQLSVRVSRDRPVFEFMEPVALELKLKNVSGRPQIVERGVLAPDAVTLIIKKQGREARQFLPFARRCAAPDPVVLEAQAPKDAIYGSILGSVGLNGWDLAEPGNYLIQAAVHIGDDDIVSAPLQLRIEPPASREEEFLAQDLFTEDAGRVLAVGGSRSEPLERGNAVLHELAERLPDRRVALHARYVLGNVLQSPYKALVVDTDAARPIAVEERPPNPDEAREFITTALGSKPTIAAESFGHIEFNELLDGFSRWLEAEGDAPAAGEALDLLYETLSARVVRGKPIRPEVLDRIERRRDQVATGEPAS